MFVRRAADKVVLLHRAQVNQGHGAEGRDALPGELREGQPAVGAGDAPVQVGPGRQPAQRVRAHRAAQEGGRRHAQGASTLG